MLKGIARTCMWKRFPKHFRNLLLRYVCPPHTVKCSVHQGRALQLVCGKEYSPLFLPLHIFFTSSLKPGPRGLSLWNPGAGEAPFVSRFPSSIRKLHETLLSVQGVPVTLVLSTRGVAIQSLDLVVSDVIDIGMGYMLGEYIDNSTIPFNRASTTSAVEIDTQNPYFDFEETPFGTAHKAHSLYFRNTKVPPPPKQSPHIKQQKLNFQTFGYTAGVNRELMAMFQPPANGETALLPEMVAGIITDRYFDLSRLVNNGPYRYEMWVDCADLPPGGPDIKLIFTNCGSVTFMVSTKKGFFEVKKDKPMDEMEGWIMNYLRKANS